MAVNFYKCAHCGNVVEKLVDSGVPVVCCGAKMEELVPGTVEASAEKHVPKLTKLPDGRLKVEVGRTHHPMTPEHYIEWVCMESENGIQLKKLKPNTSPQISFSLSKDDKVKSVFEM